MRKLILLSALVLVACADEAPPAITVGPVSFTESEMLGLSDARRATLVDLTGFALAVSDSSHRVLGTPLIRRMQDDRILDVLAAELTLEKNGVSDEVLEAQYLTDPDYELTVRHILFFSERWRTDDHREAAQEKAARALEALTGGADFAETAASLSEEPGAEGRQGLLTPGREGAWVDEFWTAASALEVGEISAVTETEYGYHILRLEERTLVPFAEGRSRMARSIANLIEDPGAVLDSFLDAAPEIFIAEDVIAASEYDSFGETALLATWDGGQLTFADFLDWAAAQPTAWNDGGLGSDRDTFRASVAALARRAQGLGEASRRGLVLSPGESEQIARGWDDQVYRWSTALGFEFGSTPSEIADAALAALAQTGQGANIARDEISQRSPLMRARYEVDIAPTGS